MSERKYLQGTFELLIAPGKKSEEGAIPVNRLITEPAGTAPTYDFTTPYGDEISLPIPEGSFKAYIEKHKVDYGGPDPYIIIFAKYHRVPGEKTPIPPGTTSTTHSVEKLSRLEKLSLEFDEGEKQT